ncbi:hypothetical protein [Streptomyces platensis]
MDQLNDEERAPTAERAGHMREVLTGYRSGSSELTADGEPRDEYTAATPMEAKKAAKAAELGVTVRTVERWLAAFRDQGEAEDRNAETGDRAPALHPRNHGITNETDPTRRSCCRSDPLGDGTRGAAPLLTAR